MRLSACALSAMDKRRAIQRGACAEKTAAFND
jgi:hypothetical protein